MKRPKRKTARSSYAKSHYQLSEVIQKINNGQVLIKKNAEMDADRQFGWGLSDIENAYRKLKSKHYYKSAFSECKSEVIILDVYKATIKGEIIYTHFYIDDRSGFLIINSFHEQ